MVKYTYDAWGNVTTKAESGYETLANTNPFRYRGYFYDTETKLYFLKSRYYDPSTGRFISQDDESYLDTESINGLNLYAYCLNNPIVLNDHEGNAPKWWEWLINGLVIVAGVVLCATGIGTALGVGLLVAGGSMLASNIMSAAGVNGKVASIISSALSIVGGIALCFTPFAAMGASMIGSGIGGIAGGYISEALGGRFETGAMIGSIVGGIIGGQVYKGVQAISASRAVAAAKAATAGGGESYKLDPSSIQAGKDTGSKNWNTVRKAIWKNEAKVRPDVYKDNLGRMLKGRAPIVDGKSMQLHHVFGKSNDLYTVVKLTQPQHVLLHKTIGYHYNSSWNWQSITDLFG